VGIIVKVGDIFGGHMSAMVFSEADVPGEDGEGRGRMSYTCVVADALI